jgi:hypothetical protein
MSTPKSKKSAAEIELKAPSDEQLSAPAAALKEEIQTNFRAKLAKKTDREDIFVPSNPIELEKAASQVAKEEGFELNRGTEIGARLIARARKMA